jgi:mono/diheme cytochrome c family protein
MPLLAALLVASCTRGQPSERTPIHLNPNMDRQEKHRPQSASRFFADGAAQRTPVAGTVARDYLRADNAYCRGLNSRGAFVQDLPVGVSIQLLKRGRERYDIYCSPCHSRAGDGRGIMVERGYPPPTSFHVDRIREFPDGQIFDVITNGVRNMPSYKRQIPVDDRWAIVAYVRALQRSQHAALEDVPPQMRGALREVDEAHAHR